MKKLQKTLSNTQKLTFIAPHILLQFKDGDFPVLTVRQGKAVQIDHTTTVDFYDQPVDERDKLFVIKAKNQVNFGNGRIEVLNDAIKNVAPSAPTASRYMSLVGKEVMIAFSCERSAAISRDVKKDAYRVVRTTIKLP